MNQPLLAVVLAGIGAGYLFSGVGKTGTKSANSGNSIVVTKNEAGIADESNNLAILNTLGDKKDEISSSHHRYSRGGQGKGQQTRQCFCWRISVVSRKMPTIGN